MDDFSYFSQDPIFPSSSSGVPSPSPSQPHVTSDVSSGIEEAIPAYNLFGSGPSTTIPVPFPPVTPVQPSSAVSGELMINEFRTKVCQNEAEHDWCSCFFYHAGYTARRRSPREISYSSELCLEFRRGTCPDGEACQLAHGMLERGLHPDFYRRTMCQYGADCKKNVCFFAHSSAELRQ